MKWKWKWKRPAACLLAAAMIFTMPGVPASAVETDVSGVSGNAPAECRGRSIPTVPSALRKMQTSLPAREQSRQRP